MQRRDFLKLSAIGLTGLGLGSLSGLNFNGFRNYSFAKIAKDGDQPLYCGWIDSPAARRQFITDNEHPFLSQLNEKIRGTGQGKTVLLWPYLEKAYNHAFTPHDQQIGDCVSHAYGLSVDLLTAVQLSLSLAPQVWVSEAATEVIYGGARIQIAGGKYRSEGCNGTDAAAFVSKYGILLRQKYLDGKCDLRCRSCHTKHHKQKS